MRLHLAILILLAGCATSERHYPVARFEGTKSPKAAAECIYAKLEEGDPIFPPLIDRKGKSYRIWDDPDSWGMLGSYDIDVGPGGFGNLVILRARGDHVAMDRLIVSCLDRKA